MANKIENKEEKKTTTKKTSASATKKTTAKKTTAKKTTPKKTTTKSSTSATKKTTTSKPKTTVKKTTTPKVVKKEEKLDKTIIIENIEHEIEKIVDNKNHQEKIEEQVVAEINNVDVAKLEDAKFEIKKKDKKLLAIGVFISMLGIIALIITLVANRVVDREYISDTGIAIMAITSILIECFGAFILINES